VVKRNLIVELPGPEYFVATDDPSDARATALRAAGDPVVSGLRVDGLQPACMRNADEDAPPGMRSDPYWVMCTPEEPGAVSGWLVQINVEGASA
jgi:hypothetical protein